MKKLLLDELALAKEIRETSDCFKKGDSCSLTGVAGTIKTTFIAALDRQMSKQGSLAFFVSGREEIREYRRALNYFYPDVPMVELYPEDLPRAQFETKNPELLAERVAALRIMRGETCGIAFVTAEALIQKIPAPKNATQGSLEIFCGQVIEQQEIIEKLARMGYERNDRVDGLGQFAVRGDILDVYPINSRVPLRIEWFDDTVDAVRNFDIDSQRSIENIESIKVMSFKSEDETEFTASAFDYIHENTLAVLDEPSRLWESCANLLHEQRREDENYWSLEELRARTEQSRFLAVAALQHGACKSFKHINIPVRSVSPYNRNTKLLVDDLKTWLAEGITPIVMMSSDIKARGLADTLCSQGVKAEFVDNAPLLRKDSVSVISGELTAGFRFWNENWLLVTEGDIFGMQKKRRLHTKNRGNKISYFSEIKVGDYVVHSLHGIGRYIGVENIIVDGIHKDYLMLQYAGTDKLFVPVEQVSMLHKYIGNEGQAPRLSKMGGSDWKRIKTKAGAAITVLAEELLRLYAQRKIVNGHAYSHDTEWQKEFERSFVYEETPDQLKAIGEIKADMERPSPMDRLLCGDVGYGKTEVAIRAAFKAVMDNKQVAVLVPTTVLAQQHFLTFNDRMSNFGVRVEVISRFCSGKEQKRILQDLEDGKIDILIGTHRLLQQDVLFPDLGLLIIDEEQRFGVAQKEKIKKWKTGIDVLCLSATPIPRTLHMALVNGRDMSVIESPPEDRLPVETYVAEYDSGMIKEAIERELRRGGRLYYVHNRVGELERIAGELRKLVPNIIIKIAHGQMSEDALEDAMISFYDGSCDVLLCTTIIENGLDVPLANTIIIDGAENFGLSQLYQMRGRVGRSSRLAYAYFVHRKNKALSEVAEKRLKAIRDFTELGAGFKIAMRDLEIRGAGNLLGAQQHGHIAGVGFATYCSMLESTIKRLKDGVEQGESMIEPIMEIPADAYIPDEYINDGRYKLELYQKFAELDYDERDDLFDEITDRFGEPPQEVVTLWRIAALRGLCRRIRVLGISARVGEIRITFDKDALIDVEMLMKLIDENKKHMNFKGGEQSQLIYKTAGQKISDLQWLEKNLPLLRRK